MLTESATADGNRATCSEELRADLAARVRQRARVVIDAELKRLAGRVSTLGRTDLDVIDAALQEVTESLILARLRDAPVERVPLLWHLLGTEVGRQRKQHEAHAYGTRAAEEPLDPSRRSR